MLPAKLTCMFPRWTPSPVVVRAGSFPSHQCRARRWEPGARSCQTSIPSHSNARPTPSKTIGDAIAISVAMPLQDTLALPLSWPYAPHAARA
ncbi:hypothetical protein CERSUDRAFT_117391 [Gelatoporia subvermispora B]|uniref:Uncharacterized protein n=1 Tax=Ceriporiopsis subvermispora (strain B) TaxID=914234 RepID=M2PDI6_CERS8|nr:hypothetical protein CERSUDRAFT_117391 [Gelatoporia subvermispora B]